MQPHCYNVPKILNPCSLITLFILSSIFFKLSSYLLIITKIEFSRICTWAMLWPRRQTSISRASRNLVFNQYVPSFLINFLCVPISGYILHSKNGAKIPNVSEISVFLKFLAYTKYFSVFSFLQWCLRSQNHFFKSCIHVQFKCCNCEYTGWTEY